MRGRLAAVLLLARAHLAAGWTTIAQLRDDPSASSLREIRQSRGALHRLWDFPTQNGWGSADEPRSVSESQLLLAPGLSSAIPYAWDPQMCAILDPLFGIDLWGFEFSSCADIAAAVRMAFDSWSSNHPRLKFIDVTNNCVAAAAAGTANYTNLSDTRPCPLARIWLTTTSASAREDSAAVTTGEYVFNHAFRHTNGRYASNGAFQTVRATIGFKKDDICWYLDATFCDTINRWKQDFGTSNVLLLCRGLIFALWAIVLADVLWIMVDVAKKHSAVFAKEARRVRMPNMRALHQKMVRAREPHKYSKAQVALGRAAVQAARAKRLTAERLVRSVDEAEEWTVMVARLARVDWAGWIVRLFLLIAPIIFYAMIFDPCFSCYDFQAAATHEIGHVLGLAHPDQAENGQNIMVQRSVGQNLALQMTARAVSNAYAQGSETTAEAAAAVATATGLDDVENATIAAAALDDCGGMDACLASARVDCWNPWIRTSVRPNNSATISPYAPSIMQAFTFNNPSKCIHQDDLDAINVLYPACDNALSVPVCNTPTSYLGIIRLVVYVGLPSMVTLVLMVLCNRLVMNMHHVSRRRGLALLQLAVQDPDVTLAAPDGTKLSDLEKRAMLLEAHIHTLTQARRQQLEKGKKLVSPEVTFLDEQIQSCYERVSQLRESDANGTVDVEEDLQNDRELLQNLLLPVKFLAKARQARVAVRYTPGLSVRSLVAPESSDASASARGSRRFGRTVPPSPRRSFAAAGAPVSAEPAHEPAPATLEAAAPAPAPAPAPEPALALAPATAPAAAETAAPEGESASAPAPAPATAAPRTAPRRRTGKSAMISPAPATSAPRPPRRRSTSAGAASSSNNATTGMGISAEDFFGGA